MNSMCNCIRVQCKNTLECSETSPPGPVFGVHCVINKLLSDRYSFHWLCIGAQLYWKTMRYISAPCVSCKSWVIQPQQNNTTQTFLIAPLPTLQVIRTLQSNNRFHVTLCHAQSIKQSFPSVHVELTTYFTTYITPCVIVHVYNVRTQ